MRASSIKPFLIRTPDDQRTNFDTIEEAYNALTCTPKVLVGEYVLGEVKAVDDYDTMVFDYLTFSSYGDGKEGASFLQQGYNFQRKPLLQDINYYIEYYSAQIQTKDIATVNIQSSTGRMWSGHPDGFYIEMFMGNANKVNAIHLYWSAYVVGRDQLLLKLPFINANYYRYNIPSVTCVVPTLNEALFFINKLSKVLNAKLCFDYIINTPS